MKLSKQKKEKLISIITLAALFVAYLYNCYDKDLSVWARNVFAPLLQSSSYVPEKGKAEVHFIDVGQGSSILIRNSESVVLIDAAEAQYADEIIDYIKNLGVEKIDYFFATHPHFDHMGGCEEIMRNIDTDNFVMTKLSDDAIPTTQYYLSLLSFCNENKNNIKVSEIKTGSTYDFGDGMVFKALGPLKRYIDYNDTSIVLQMDFGDTSFLFTGDMTDKAERDLLEAGVLSDIDVLSAPHHGSSTSIDRDFMNTILPEYSVISCGKDNDYGHPHRETIALYDEMNIEYYRTDKLGSIVFYTDGENIDISY